jgi:tetratricopeptide (TPR) repeat protein
LLLRDIAPSELDETLKALADARLLYTFTTAEGESRIAPTFLLEQWTLAEGWANSQLPFLQWLVPFDRYRCDWIRTNYDPGCLLSGQLLADAKRWATERANDLTDEEHTYIKRSTEHIRRQRLLIASVTTAILILVAIGWSLQLWKDYQAKSASTRSATLIDQARFAATYGDLNTAAARYADAIVLVPTNSGARIKHAWLLDQLGHPKDAIKEFDTALDQLVRSSSSPDSNKSLLADAYLGRGIAQFHAGDIADALIDLRQAETAQPSPVVKFNRAVILESVGELKQALQEYTAAINGQPDFADAIFNRGVLYEKLGDESPRRRRLPARIRTLPPPSGFLSLSSQHCSGGTDKRSQRRRMRIRSNPDFGRSSARHGCAPPCRLRIFGSGFTSGTTS